jgi:hypothetical protein
MKMLLAKTIIMSILSTKQMPANVKAGLIEIAQAIIDALGANNFRGVK